MVTPLLSLPKLQSRSTPSKSPNLRFSCESRIKSQPASRLFSSYKHGVDISINSGPLNYLKRSRMTNRSRDVTERKKSPRKNYRECLRGTGETRQPQWSRPYIRQLGFWYMATSIRHILRRAKAFYNELYCDAYDDPKLSSGEVMNIDPYFSVPVVEKLILCS
ncbi:hypothetical protein CDL15_Pgr028754 [Punica granatum]|uniref:Uncharacterized protein n=1 Tax=Punica granatum TaxID=22663 RepID=A0A218VX93_PUNGR|nr:hypothetical protein CDL15_Pgr028754 [Punica granatum]